MKGADYDIKKTSAAAKKGKRYCSLEMISRAFLPIFLVFLSLAAARGQDSIPFSCTPLNIQGDLSAIMVERIDTFLLAETKRVSESRNGLWKRDFSSPQAFNRSIASKRLLLSQILGVEDTRLVPGIELMTGSDLRPLRVETGGSVIRAVRWKVLEGLTAEGLWIEPKGKVLARVVLVPDADMLPEVLAGILGEGKKGYNIARELAAVGCEVLIPVLASRGDQFSGSPSLHMYTNQTHREWIYRQGYEVGRHVIGYELQKIFSAVDWMESRNKKEGSNVRIGVAGYGEGGLLALDAAALDTRISSTLVSGYFDRRESLWKEPIYRNVFGILRNFGDAELAVMSWPRRLVIEAARAPEVPGPPAESKGRYGAAPGVLQTPDIASAKTEWERAAGMLPARQVSIRWCSNGNVIYERPFSAAALVAFTSALKVSFRKPVPALKPIAVKNWVDTAGRQERTVRGMEGEIQKEIVLAERVRDKNFWQRLKGDTSQQEPVKEVLRKQFWQQIGKLPVPSVSMNPQAKVLERNAKWTSYEVKLDVWPGVFAWGILLVPTDIKPGERRPVVVCQHGLESQPMDVITKDPHAQFYHFYKGFAATLAERGYITFAPCNLYRGEDKFRVLQREANPLGLTLFSVMIGQHQRMLEWLKQLSFVDPVRIGFYGLSYGGKSAMRIPAVVKGYAFSICSGDFNEWIRKCASTDYSFSYLFTGEYDMQEWDLGHTFSYAEMAALIAPRPFMVERGHYDGVANDEWVGYEFAKVKRHYDLIGLPGSVRIEYFVGPHTIHGVGTFQFIDRVLKGKKAGRGRE